MFYISTGGGSYQLLRLNHTSYKTRTSYLITSCAPVRDGDGSVAMATIVSGGCGLVTPSSSIATTARERIVSHTF